MCGNTNLYCPGYGNYQPTIVSKGYYSIGLNESTRTDQRIAPKGSYAVNGILYKCSAGRYGAIEGLSSSSCSGVCNINGYYCPRYYSSTSLLSYLLTYSLQIFKVVLFRQHNTYVVMTM